MEDDRPEAGHTPAFNEVPPADSIGRHLCEVVCSCGLFRTTALGRDADAARADALHSFDAHRARATDDVPRPPRRHLTVVPPSEPTPPAAPGPRRRRRVVPVVAVLTVSVVAVVGVVAALALVGSRNDYAGAPTLVGGPDRTGPATFATTTVSPTEAAHSVERGDRYDDLRAGSPEVKLWSDDRIDQVSRQICGLLEAGRQGTQLVDALAGRGIDTDTVGALTAYAERFDC